MAWKKVEVDKKDIGTRGVRYSSKQKLQAVALYRLTGSYRAVQHTTGIPYQTLMAWRSQAWWDEYSEELRTASRAELTGKIGKIIEKSLKVVEDRLDNGDFHFDQKTGQVFRKPVGAHVANRIANDAIDRQMLMEKLQREEKKEHNEELMKDKLLQLHEEFAKFSKARVINPNDEEEVIQPTITPELKQPEGLV